MRGATVGHPVSEVTAGLSWSIPHVKGKVTVVPPADGLRMRSMHLLSGAGGERLCRRPFRAAVKIVPDANARSEGGGSTERSGLAATKW